MPSIHSPFNLFLIARAVPVGNVKAFAIGHVVLEQPFGGCGSSGSVEQSCRRVPPWPQLLSVTARPG